MGATCARPRIRVGLRPRSRDRGSRSGHAPSSGPPVRRRARRRARPARRPRRRRARRPWLLLGLHVDLGVGLLLVRAEHHDHVAAVLLRRGLDEAQLRDVLGQLLQQPEAQLGAVLLATAEHDRDLDLVPGAQEPHDVTLLGLVVVRVDLRTKLHLLDDHVRLVPTGLASLLGVLVLELAVVHELADRRLALRGDLDEVEVRLLGKLQGLVGRHDADRLPVGSDEPDLGNPDPVVDSQLGADVSSWWQFGRRSLSFVTPEKVVRNQQKASAVCKRKPVRRLPRMGDTTEDHVTVRTSYVPRPEPSGPDPTTCGAGRSMRVGDDRASLRLRICSVVGTAELIGQHRNASRRFPGGPNPSGRRHRPGPASSRRARPAGRPPRRRSGPGRPGRRPAPRRRPGAPTGPRACAATGTGRASGSQPVSVDGAGEREQRQPTVGALQQDRGHVARLVVSEPGVVVLDLAEHRHDRHQQPRLLERGQHVGVGGVARRPGGQGSAQGRVRGPVVAGESRVRDHAEVVRPSVTPSFSRPIPGRAQSKPRPGVIQSTTQSRVFQLI